MNMYFYLYDKFKAQRLTNPNKPYFFKAGKEVTSAKYDVWF